MKRCSKQDIDDWAALAAIEVMGQPEAHPNGRPTGVSLRKINIQQKKTERSELVRLAELRLTTALFTLFSVPFSAPFLSLF